MPYVRKCKTVNLALFLLGNSPASEFHVPTFPMSSEQEVILPCVCVRYPVLLSIYVYSYLLDTCLYEDIITHDSIPRNLIFYITAFFQIYLALIFDWNNQTFNNKYSKSSLKGTPFRIYIIHFNQNSILIACAWCLNISTKQNLVSYLTLLSFSVIYRTLKLLFFLLADPPEGDPKLQLEKTRYAVGDTLRGNCSSAASSPPTNLTWIVNGKRASTADVSQYVTLNNLYVS